MNNNNLNGFYLSIGKQGEGKTLFIIKLLVDNYIKGKNVFSNTTLFNIPYKKITLGNEEEKKKGALDILEVLDNDHNYFNNSIMILDEIHIYLDSLDFMRKNNRRLQVFFSQLRKRNILLLGTTQYIMNVDIRIRRQCKNVFEMKKLNDKDLKELIRENYIKPKQFDDLLGNLFKVTTHEIDGYYTSELSEYYIDLRSYFNYYDTNEIIL